MYKKSQFENIVNILFPNWQIEPKEDYIDSSLTEALFNVWKDHKNMVKSDVYRKPYTMSRDILNGLVKDGLIKEHGSNLKITKKGKDVLKVMVLGDDRSAFEDDGKIVSHTVAKASTKLLSTKSAVKMSQYYEDIWWNNIC